MPKQTLKEQNWEKEIKIIFRNHKELREDMIKFIHTLLKEEKKKWKKKRFDSICGEYVPKLKKLKE